MDREKGELDTFENSKSTAANPETSSNEKMRERGKESRSSQKSDLTKSSLTNVKKADMPRSRSKKTFDEGSRKPYNDGFNGISNETACGILGRRLPTERTDDKSELLTNNVDSRVLNHAAECEAPATTRQTSIRAGTEETVMVVVCACVSASSEGHQTGRVHLYVINDQNNTASFRQQHGIWNVIATKGLMMTNDLEARILVRLLLRGEDKDSWRHCEAQDGEKAFPEEQRLDLAKILHHRSAFPVTAHWFLETPEKCPPSLHLEAVLLIQQVPRGVTSPTWDDSSEGISIPVEVGE